MATLGWHPLYTTVLICLSFPRGAATRGNKGRGTEARNKKQSVRQPFVCRWAVRGVALLPAGWEGAPLLLLARAGARGRKGDRMRKGNNEGERNVGNYLFGREHFAVIFISFPRKTPLTRARPDLRFHSGGVDPRERSPASLGVSPRERDRQEWPFEQVRPLKSKLETFHLVIVRRMNFRTRASRARARAWFSILREMRFSRRQFECRGKKRGEGKKKNQIKQGGEGRIERTDVTSDNWAIKFVRYVSSVQSRESKRGL